MTINIKDGISALLAIRLVERVLMEGKPVEKPTMDDRPVKQISNETLYCNTNQRPT